MHVMGDATSTAFLTFSKEKTTCLAANLLRAWIERYGKTRGNPGHDTHFRRSAHDFAL